MKTITFLSNGVVVGDITADDLAEVTRALAATEEDGITVELRDDLFRCDGCGYTGDQQAVLNHYQTCEQRAETISKVEVSVT